MPTAGDWWIPATATAFIATTYKQPIWFKSFNFKVKGVEWTHAPGARPFTDVHPVHEMADAGWKWSGAHRYQVCFNFRDQGWVLEEAGGRFDATFPPKQSFLEVGVNDTWLNGYADNTGGFWLELWGIDGFVD